MVLTTGLQVVVLTVGTPWTDGLYIFGSRNVAFFDPGPAGRAYLGPTLEQTQTQMAGKAGLWCAESERMEREASRKRTLSEAQEEWSPEELASKVRSVPIASLWLAPWLLSMAPL